MRDFTQEKYNQLCEAIERSRHKTVTVAEFIEIKKVTLHDRLIILRHDVDRFPRCALELAKIEKKFGLKASYYFRVPSSCDEAIIRNIAQMGHEVGLHYECLDKAKGDIQKAGEILKQELDFFNNFADVKTVSMHGNPATKYDNRDLWKHFSLKQFGLSGEVYLSIDFERVMYFSDTGRTWLEGKYNIKDIIPDGMKTVSQKPTLKKTDDVIHLIENDDRNIYLLIHPSRWPGSFGGWVASFVSDVVLNTGKVIYKTLFKVAEG